MRHVNCLRGSFVVFLGLFMVGYSLSGARAKTEMFKFSVKASEIQESEFSARPTVFAIYLNGSKAKRVNAKIKEKSIAFPTDTINCSIKVPVSKLWNLYIQLDGVNPGDAILYITGYSDAVRYNAGDNIVLLSLKGTYEEMGKQYGYLMKNELKDYYQTIVDDFLITQKGMVYSDLLDAAEDFFKMHPICLRDVLEGMAETSELGMEKTKIINYSSLAIGDSAAQCSGVAAWGDYSSFGKMVFGRNWDYNMELFKQQMPYFCVTVFNPTNSGNAVANIHPLGQIWLETAMNDKGIFMELNNGSRSDDASYDDRFEAMAQLFTILAGSDSFDDLDKSFNSALPSEAYIINCADSKNAYSYQWATFSNQKRSGEYQGLLVATNHFVNPPEAWQIPAIAEDDNSYIRRQNLLSLANSGEYKGLFDAQKMRALISVAYEDGGAFFPDATVYQVVAVPEDFTVWIKLTDVQGWTEIDLKKLFTSLNTEE